MNKDHTKSTENHNMVEFNSYIPSAVGPELVCFADGPSFAAASASTSTGLWTTVKVVG